MRKRNFFDFKRIGPSEETIKRTWSELGQALANKEFSYNDLESALQTTYLRVFDDLLTNCHELFDVQFSKLISEGTCLVRAARVNAEDKTDYERFIPKSQYIKSANRFSPAGVEWLYLALGSEELYDGELLTAERCALCECRAQKDDSFAICRFAGNNAFEKAIIADLTIADGKTYDDINLEFEQESQKYVDDQIIKIIYTGQKTPERTLEIERVIKTWAATTYSKLLSQQIFVPVDSSDRDLVYAPFQCMANYFMSKGYSGIVYSSTVYPNGRNIVLFDKSMAVPVGDIKTLVI